MRVRMMGNEFCRFPMVWVAQIQEPISRDRRLAGFEIGAVVQFSFFETNRRTAQDSELNDRNKQQPTGQAAQSGYLPIWNKR